ncbi:MAG: zinc-dependent peptidase [Wenzhouxiangella sp.]|nr:zinc-dependent peptidase [Wenzhouxiangella sp.]TVR93434.1 MAG: zinc-dependent peptidase [Wenzhouxiangellaceae bacterium]
MSARGCARASAAEACAAVVSGPLARLKAWQRERRLERVRPQRADFERRLARFPMLAALPGPAREVLFERSTEILAGKDFFGAGGLEPDADDLLDVALLAALPVLNLGVDWYRGFHTFILYPAEFVAEVEQIDEDGLVHLGDEVRSGEAWAHGPVVLAMDEVRGSGQGEGFNVVAHELAHQIDQLNGDMDGYPPLPAGMEPARWAATFSAAWQRLQTELAQGAEPSMDPYAAESPAEFFAVASEMYFDVPGWLADTHPELYQQLDSLYQLSKWF